MVGWRGTCYVGGWWGRQEEGGGGQGQESGQGLQWSKGRGGGVSLEGEEGPDRNGSQVRILLYCNEACH